MVTPRKGRGRMDFEAMIARGELDGPDGFQAQTANGTAHWKGTGWNKDYKTTRPEVAPDRTRPAGRSNRTGE